MEVVWHHSDGRKKIFGVLGYTIEGEIPPDATKIEFKVGNKNYQTLLQTGTEGGFGHIVWQQ